MHYVQKSLVLLRICQKALNLQVITLINDPIILGKIQRNKFMQHQMTNINRIK